MALWTSRPFLLQRAWSDNAQESLDQMASTLDDLVRVGAGLCEALQAPHSSPDNTMDSDKVVGLLLLRSVLAQADAIALLIRVRTATPCVPLVRGVFESHLAVRWLLQGDRMTKARAYAVAEKMRLLAMIRMSLPGTSEFDRVRREATADDLLHSVAVDVPLAEVREQEQQLLAELDSEPFKAIAVELRGMGNRANWYSVGGGPQHLRDLAKHLGMLGPYETLYRMWSTETHGSNALRGMARVGERRFGLAPLRLVQDIPGLFEMACMLVVGVCTDLASAFDTPEIRADWSYAYVAHLRARIQRQARTSYIEPAPKVQGG